MTNEQALARLIFELDDIARCEGGWLKPRRHLKRLKRAITKASSLATQPDLGEWCEKTLSKGTVL